MAPRTKKQDNQSEEEFFAIATTGQKGIVEMFGKKGAALHKIAAANVKGDFDVWKTRAMVEIANNSDLSAVINTKAGLLSIYHGLYQAATAGLQIGGHVPQVYFVPKAGKAVMIPTKEGYAQVCTYGPGAPLREYPELHRVHEKDGFRIDDAARTYDHQYEPFEDRGKVVGYFIVLEYKDGRRIIPHILQSKVRQIQSDYKMSAGPAWTKSPDEMDEKTAMKWLLRYPFRESEGRAMIESLDVDYDIPEEPAPDMRDVTERVVDRVSKAADAMEPTEPEPKSATDPEPEAGESGEAEPADGNKLF